MYQEIVPILCCPCCRRSLHLKIEKQEQDEIISGELICSCGRHYSIRDGIADFGSHEQENINNWSDYYAQVCAEELDRNLNAHKSKNLQKIEIEFLHKITEQTAKLSEGFLLDIASGRGMLLQEHLKTARENVHIIAADLSFQVLKYDRMKFKKQAPERRINYIACDAAHLPFRTGTVDMISTYVGFVNMGSLAEAGIEESARVLKFNGTLVNSCIYLKEQTEGFQNLKKIFLENGITGAENFLLEQEIKKIHHKYFTSLSDQIAYEGIAETSEDDLIPLAGEWFADVVITAIK